MTHWYNFFNHEWFWGIITGFIIGELSSVIRHLLANRRIKLAILDELRANQYQIAQKQDVVRKMIKALEEQSYRSGLTVPALTAIFENHYPSVITSYDANERDNLHLIYSRLKINDMFLNGFEQKFKEELSGKLLTDPWAANISQLRDIHESYRVTSDLIAAFLKGHPLDVLYRHSRAKPPSNRSDSVKP